MSLSGPILCPVCGKKAKTGSAIDCARHMFGTGDQPHRKWVDEAVAPQGTDVHRSHDRAGNKPGNASYVLLGEVIQKDAEKTEAEKQRNSERAHGPKDRRNR